MSSVTNYEGLVDKAKFIVAVREYQMKKQGEKKEE